VEKETSSMKAASPFFLKDYIDRKFMKKFQVAGEFNEKE